MLSSFSPYVPQGLMPQSVLGLPQASPGFPGQQSAYGYGIGAPYGYDHQGQPPQPQGATHRGGREADAHAARNLRTPR